MKKKLQTKFSTRQYMVSKDFELYYYEDNRPVSVVAHEHDYYEFYFFLDGAIETRIEGKGYNTIPGDLILIPPGVSHYRVYLEENKPYRRFVLWISEEYVNRLTTYSDDYAYLIQYAKTTKNYIFHNDTITFNAIQSKLFQLIEESLNSRYGKDTEVSLQINSLFLFLNRLIYERNHPDIKRDEQKLYLKICDYISENLTADLSLDNLAVQFFANKFYISHAFKENMGISIHQYIIKKRLDACKNAILSADPISKIYTLYGFRDYSSFYRCFKKEYGISPKEYKEKSSLFTTK